MPTEQCYGAVVVYKDTENLFLLLQNSDAKEIWGFPKGHHEGDETPKETALREIEEETGITQINLLDMPLIREEYGITRDGEKVNKINEYYIGFVKDKNVVLKEDEISNYKWVPFEEALESIIYSTRKETLKKAQEYLNMVK